MSPYFMGIDAGTTIIKTVLFNIDGTKIAESSRENKITLLRNGGAEIDLDEYWKGVAECIQEITAMPHIHKHNITSLAVAANGVTFMPVDKAGKSLRKAFSYLDTRGTEEADELLGYFGQHLFFVNTGQPRLQPFHVIVKTLWMKHHEPEIFDDMDKLVMVHAYLSYKLTGELRATYSLAATTGFLKLIDGSTWDDALNTLGISVHSLCDINNAGERIGTVLPEVAEYLGLLSDTTVICGSLDQAAGCIGSGNIFTGNITESTGTVLAINATVDKPVLDVNNPIPCFAHAVRDKYIMLPWYPFGGSVLKWFRDEFLQSTEYGTFVEYEQAIAGVVSVPIGCEGLILLPQFPGENSSENNEYATGAFFNVGFHHTRSHFIRAILESTGFLIRKNMEMLQSLNVACETLCSIGGGARSSIWNQIKADILQMPIRTCEIEEAGALGACILAAVGCGEFTSIGECCTHFVRFNKTYEPDRKNAQQYQECYEKYIELDGQMKK